MKRLKAWPGMSGAAAAPTTATTMAAVAKSKATLEGTRYMMRALALLPYLLWLRLFFVIFHRGIAIELDAIAGRKVKLAAQGVARESLDEYGASCKGGGAYRAISFFCMPEAEDLGMNTMYLNTGIWGSDKGCRSGDGDPLGLFDGVEIWSDLFPLLDMHRRVPVSGFGLVCSVQSSSSEKGFHGAFCCF
jgi:hypothetical protein